MGSRRLWALAVGAGLGCNGGGEGPDFDGVRAATLRTYVRVDGSEVEASADPLADGTKMTLEAGGQRVPGVYDGSAWVEFAGAPEGTYTLRRDAPPDPSLPGMRGLVELVTTTARELYVGEVHGGRPDVALAESAATMLEVSATDMMALGPTDTFQLYSHNADALDLWTINLSFEGGTPPPAEGSTAIEGWVAPWNPSSTRGGRPLVDPGQGDDLWLLHVRSSLVDDQPNTYVDSLVEAARLDGPAMVDGQTTAVRGAFVAAPQTTLSINLQAGDFFAALATNLAAPAATSCGVRVALDVGEDAPVRAVGPMLGSILIFGYDAPVDPGCVGDCATEHVPPADVVLDLPYGNPFPRGTEVLTAWCQSRAWALAPSLTNDDLVAEVSITGPVAELAHGELWPTLVPVQDIRLDGATLPLNEVRTGVGTTPTIGFTPPMLGAPDSYTVVVRTFAVGFDPADGAPGNQIVATFATTDTSVTLPDGILEPGVHYNVEVVASAGRELTAGRPRQFAQASASATTGVFTP